MAKKWVVLSLGGSVIASDPIDTRFLADFSDTLKKNSRKYKFIVVCGGGQTARKYIDALSKRGVCNKTKSIVGIGATRLNAEFMSCFFNKNCSKKIPLTKKELAKLSKKETFIFCGALEYKPRQTSDSTAAEIARDFKSDFINITNVQGLFNKDPRKFKNAKLISSISWKDFYKKASAISFKPGEHFVLDQTASKIIMRNRIKTIILGKDAIQLERFLNGKKFKGTVIEN